MRLMYIYIYVERKITGTTQIITINYNYKIANNPRNMKKHVLLNQQVNFIKNDAWK